MGIEEGIKLADQLHRERLLREDRKRRAEEEKIKREQERAQRRQDALSPEYQASMSNDFVGRTMARDDAVARQRADEVAGKIGGSAGLTLSQKAGKTSSPGVGAMEYRREGLITPTLTEEDRGRNREDLRASRLSTRPADAPSEVIAATRYGLASKELLEAYEQKWKDDDPRAADEKIQKSYAEMQKYQWAVPAEANDDQSWGEMFQDRDFYLSVVSSLPASMDIMKYQIGAAIVGTLVASAGAGLVATGVGAPVGAGVIAASRLIGGGIMAGGAAYAAHKEANMEGAGIYAEALSKALEQGMTEAQAHEIATAAADKGYWMNLGVLGATNLAEQFMAVGLPVSTVAKGAKAMKLAEETRATIRHVEMVKTIGKGKNVLQKSQDAVTGIKGKVDDSLDVLSKKGKAGAVAAGTIKGGARIGGTMATEGGQEGLQYGIQEVALGNDPDWGSAEFRQNVGAGAVMGGVFAGAGAGIRGMVNLANATKGEEGKKLDPLDVNVEIGESFDLAFPKIERIDPILEENYLSKIREAMPAEMKTIMDNNTQVYLDKGESEKVAVYKALDDLMSYPEFRDLALDIYIGTLKEFQHNGIQEAGQFAVYGTVISSLPKASQDVLQNEIVNEAHRVGDVNTAYANVMQRFMDSPEGQSHIDNILIPALMQQAEAYRGQMVAQGQNPTVTQEYSEGVPQTFNPYDGSLFQNSQEIADSNIYRNRQFKESQRSFAREHGNVNAALNDFLVKDLGADVAKIVISDVSGALASVVKPTEFHAKVQKAINDAFGHQVVFFEANPVLQKNGFVMDGALRDGVIYVNVNSENPMAHIIGHEIGHAIEISKTFDKTGYKVLVKAAKEAGIKNKQLQDFVFDNTSKESEALLREIVNNIIGDAMNSEAFWQKLYKESPKVFMDLYHLVKKLVAAIRDTFIGETKADYDTRELLDNADELIAKAEKVLQAYSRHRMAETSESKVRVKELGITVEGKQKRVFVVYDVNTGEEIWRADSVGVAGRAPALEIKAKIDSGELTVNDVKAGILQPQVAGVSVANEAVAPGANVSEAEERAPQGQTEPENIVDFSFNSREEAQEEIDRFEQELMAEYGEDVVYDTPLENPDAISDPTEAQDVRERLENSPLSRDEIAKLRALYAARDSAGSTTPEATPEATPETAPETTPETAPETTPEATPEKADQKKKSKAKTPKAGKKETKAPAKSNKEEDKQAAREFLALGRELLGGDFGSESVIDDDLSMIDDFLAETEEGDGTKFQGPLFKYAPSTAKSAVSSFNGDLRAMGILPKGERLKVSDRAWNKLEYRLADQLATVMSGKGIIPVILPESLEGVRGYYDPVTNKILINEEKTDPITYVAIHEVVHSIQFRYPEVYEKIKKVALSNIKKDAMTKVVVKYLGRGYDLSEVSDEFTADLVAEALHDMIFIQILRATAPETIQPILKAVESVIAQIKAIVRVLAGGNIEVNDSVLPFIESMERLRRELAPVMVEYLQSVEESRKLEEQYRKKFPFGFRKSTGGVATREKTASFSSEKLDKLYSAFSVDERSSHKDYAQRYVTYISPEEFLSLTTSKESLSWIERQSRERYGKLDVDTLSKEYNSPVLIFDQETGQVTGHEGRHRMVLLRDEGVKRVAITLDPRPSERGKYSREKLTSLRLLGQDFGHSKATGEVTLDEAIPLSNTYKEEVYQKFGDATGAEVRYKRGTAADEGLLYPTGGIEVKGGFYWSEFDHGGKPDLAVVGSEKILREGLTDYESWSESMSQEFGNEVKNRLRELWRKSNGLADFTRRKERGQQERLNRTGADYVEKEEAPSGVVYPVSGKAGKSNLQAGQKGGGRRGISEAGGDYSLGWETAIRYSKNGISKKVKEGDVNPLTNKPYTKLEMATTNLLIKMRDFAEEKDMYAGKKAPELIYDIEVGADEEGNPGLYYIDANTAEVVFELVPHKKTGEDGYPIKPKKLLTSKEVAEAEERLNKFISKRYFEVEKNRQTAKDWDDFDKRAEQRRIEEEKERQRKAAEAEKAKADAKERWEKANTPEALRKVLMDLVSDYVRVFPEAQFLAGNLVNDGVVVARVLPKGNNPTREQYRAQVVRLRRFVEEAVAIREQELREAEEDARRAALEKAKAEREERMRQLADDTPSPEYLQKATEIIKKFAPHKLAELEQNKGSKRALADMVKKIKENIAKAKEEPKPPEQRTQKNTPKSHSTKIQEAIYNANQSELAKYKNLLEKAASAVDGGARLTDEEAATLQDVFRAYQERTVPASIGDSVASQVMQRLGLNLNMGINYFTNFLTGIPELKFFWEISGNLAEYAEDLHKLGFMFDPETKHYIYKSFSAVESPLRNLMDKLGGQDYIDIAKQVEENEKAGIETPFPISRLTDRVEGGEHPTGVYDIGKGKNKRKMFVAGGIVAKNKLSTPIDEKTWGILREHQKDGVKLGIQAMEKFGSFILGDGTGAGKTMIELAVAEHYAKNGKSVLIVTQGESVYNDAFVRDAKLLAEAGSDFWKNRLIFLNSGSTKIDDKHFEETGQTRITSNRGTFQEGKINVISYDYLSLGSESILDKLKLDKYPDIVIFDECHNLRNIHENPGAIVRGKEYERTPKGKELLGLKPDKGGRKSLQGYELAMQSEKALYASATLFNKGPEVLYLNKIGFVKNYRNNVQDFMSRFGYTLVNSKRMGDYWRSDGINYSAGQLQYFFEELQQAGVALKREIDMTGVSIDVQKFTTPPHVASLLDKVVSWVEARSKQENPVALKLMAQRRVIETQKVAAAVEMAKKELAEGRKVIIFAEGVNDLSFQGLVASALLEDSQFIKYAQSEAQKKKINIDDEDAQREFVAKMIKEGLGITDNDFKPKGTLSSLNEELSAYMESEWSKAHKGKSVPRPGSFIAKVYGKGSVEDQIKAFQGNPWVKIALVTPEKGGVGISLDDELGTEPRTIIMVTPTFGGITLSQVIGRAWRLNTKSDLRVKFIMSDSEVDAWGMQIALNKLIIMGAAFKQSDSVALGEAVEGGLTAKGGDEFTTSIDRNDYEEEEENMFQSSFGRSPEKQKLIEKLSAREAAHNAVNAKSATEYVGAMKQYTEAKAEELRAEGQEEEAAIVEETQVDLENQVEFLNDLKNEIGEMIDSEVEKAREAGYELNTVEDVIQMREEQGYKDEGGFFATYKKHLEELQKNKKPEPPRNKHEAHRAKHGASRRRADKDRHYEENAISEKEMRTELVLTPKNVLDAEGGKGVAWALEEKGIAGLFAVLTSEQCATKGQLEKWVAGDSLINKLRLGLLVFRARKTGKVNEKEFRKYLSASLYWKQMENWVDDKVALKLFEEFAMGDVQSAEKSVYKLARMYSGVAVRTYRDFVKKAEEVAVNLRGDDGLYSADMEEYVHQRAVYLHIQEVKEFQLNKRIEKATDVADKRGKKLTASDLAKIEDDFKKSFIESNITQQRLNQMRGKLSRTEQQRADRAHQELLKFYRGILDELLESGVVSEDSYKTITTAYPNYVPLYRDMSDRTAADIDSGKLVQDLRKGAFEKALYPLDYFHGSQRPVINMIDNMIHYHSKARQSMELNRVITALDYLVDEFKGTDHEGKFIKVHSDTSILKDAVYYDENGNIISKNEFDKYFENPDALMETEIDGSGVGRMVVSKSRDNTPYMVARKNGETVLYEVHPAIIEALRTMQKSDPRNKEDAWIRNVAVKTGDWLRTGATASPDFWVKNMFRDTTYAYTVSDTEMNFMSDLMKSSVYVVARKFFKDDAEFNGWWDDYMAQGGGMGTRLNDIAARRMAYRNEVLGMGSPYGRKNIFSSRGARFIDSCTTVPLQRLQAAASTAETASRFAEFVAAKKAGLSDEEAAFRAMDQQDYGMSGKRVRFLNKVIPFFNAPIQSKYKIFRAFKKHPGAVVARSLRAITVPTIFEIGMQAFFADDDQKNQILEAHDSIRTNFWLIPVPGGHGVVRIAKPFDMSVLFANTLESIYEYAWQIDPITAETALKEFLYRNTKYSLLSWSLMPQVMSIATEAIWGKNWFYGTDVVPLVEQDLSPDLQFDANSYHLTIFMAKMVNDLGLSNVPGFGVLASPRRSESLINTTFASLGTLTLDMIDIAWDTTAFLTGKETYREEVKGERPRSDSDFAKFSGRDATSWPVLKSFLLNNDYGASVSEFYDEYNKLEAMQKSYNAEMAAGRPEAALKKFPEKDYRKYVIYKDAFDAMNTMKPGNKLYRMVRDSRHLTGEEKGRMLKQISADRNRYAREIMLWSKMYDAGIEDMLEKAYDYEAKQQAPFASSESYDERAGNVENMGEDLRVKFKEKITEIEEWTKAMNAKGKNGAAN